MASRSLGALTIELIAKIGGFREGMTQAERIADKKSRDIKRKFDKHAKDIEQTWSGITRALSAGIAGITVGAAFQQMTSIAKETANAAREVQNFAALAGTSTQDFQRLAIGAGTVGISAEKLADQFKDFNEKTGEFLDTGGGGMKDFFEQIAPRVGITAEAFRNLSGPQALQLYYNSLEKAGLSQKQMSFYLESMASDTTALIPLLKSNGQEWQNLGDAAERAGAIMGADAIAAAKAYKEQSDLLDMSMQGVRNEIMQSLLPAMTDLNSALTDPSIHAGIQTTINLLTDTAAKVFDLGTEFLLGMEYADGFWDALFKYGLSNPFATSQEQIESLGRELEEEKQRAEKFSIFWTDAQKKASVERQKDLEQQIGYYRALDRLQNKRTENTLNALGREGLDTYESALPAAVSASPTGKPQKKGLTGGKSQAEKDAEAAQRYIESLKRQADQVQQMGQYEKLLYDLREGTLRITDAATLKEAERLAIQADFAKDGQERERERNRLMEEGVRLAEQMRTPLEQLTAEQERINQLYEAGAISAETQARALQMAQVAAFGMAGELERWIRGDVQPLSGGRFDDQQARYEAEAMAEEERYAAQLERLTQAMEAERLTREEFYTQYEAMAQVHAERMAQIEQAKRDIMIDNMAAGFGQMASDLSDFATQFGVQNKAMLGVVKAAAIAQTIMQTYKSAQDAYASMVSIPYVGPALGTAAAAAAVAGGMARVAAIRSQGFAEGGYTGPGGKYEIAGFVHKDEGVLNKEDMRALGGPVAFERFRKSLHGYSDGGVVGLPPAVARGYDSGRHEASAPTVNVIEDASKAGRVESNRGTNGEDVINIFVSNIRTGGKAAQAIESTYGMARLGT